MQTPFHSDINVEVAYDAAKPKIDLATPENSQLVTRLRANHNCWTNDCESDAQEMEDAIREYANLIQDEVIDAGWHDCLGRQSLRKRPDRVVGIQDRRRQYRL
jgi:hypothetical protein